MRKKNHKIVIDIEGPYEVDGDVRKMRRNWMKQISHLGCRYYLQENFGLFRRG